jgi:hypothetical protein
MNKIDKLFAVRVPCYSCGKVVLVRLEDAITLGEDYHTVACSRCPHAADCECDDCVS